MCPMPSRNVQSPVMALANSFASGHIIFGLCAFLSEKGMQNMKKSLQSFVNKVVDDYLYQISSLRRHKHFALTSSSSNKATSLNQSGFQMIDDATSNRLVIDEEHFIEGCTRVFLINPIIEELLKLHNIENDWQFGTTFGNYTITNREYELCSYIEFIAVIDGKKIGCRYTPAKFSTEELSSMAQFYAYIYNKKEIPGFKNLSPIDELWSIDWSVAHDDLRKEIDTKDPATTHTSCKEISVRKFLSDTFSEEECELVLQATKEALRQAREIVALNATPQLLPNNILFFKNTILSDLTKETIASLEYSFKEPFLGKPLCESDIQTLNEIFFDMNMREALIGTSDFSKSFITSEYLFKIIKSGLSIDYTAVVVGYLKSVEQLLYVLYLSAFEGANRMKYWDRCNKDKYFDLAKDQYRIDPYNPGWRQEFYVHKKKTKNFAPDVGELIRFLRYYEKMWCISERGKEYVVACLEDFRSSCRNSCFHKDNIDFQQYENVKRIRINAILCLYYLLGGFKCLDNRTSANNQLGIIDFSFENFYNEIHTRRRRIFWVAFPDGYEGIAYYLNKDKQVVYDAAGELSKAELMFVKLYDLTSETLTTENIEARISNEAYLSNNQFAITKKIFPVKIRPIMLRKTKKA